MSPDVLGIFNEPTSTAIVMHSSVNLQVQHLQEHLQLQSTTRQKKVKEKEKKYRPLSFFHLVALLSHGRRPGAESFWLISADKCTAYSEEGGGLGEVGQKGQCV